MFDFYLLLCFCYKRICETQKAALENEPIIREIISPSLRFLEGKWNSHGFLVLCLDMQPMHLASKKKGFVLSCVQTYIIGKQNEKVTSCRCRILFRRFFYIFASTFFFVCFTIFPFVIHTCNWRSVRFPRIISPLC